MDIENEMKRRCTIPLFHTTRFLHSAPEITKIKCQEKSVSTNDLELATYVQ